VSFRRRFIVPFLLVGFVHAPSASAADQVIAPGVKAGGVDLGGQTVESAATNLDLALRPQLERPIDVVVGGESFRLDALTAKVRFDPLVTAKRAYYAGRDAGPARPPVIEVPLAYSWSKRATRAFAAGIDKKVSRAPREASVKITLRRMVIRRGKNGRTINEVSLARRLDATFADQARPRALRARFRPDRPTTTTAKLRRQYGTVITVDRTNLKLRLFKRLRISKTYGIAIGAAGFDTPSGQFRIQSKQVNPAWHVPNSDWAGGLQGQTIPGGAPNNPLKARWLGVNGSVGIHGTAEEWSIGTRASHGCIRMRVSDVIDLYPRVPMGTPVLIK
jgi:lipoprotein-anchoring transpeptidase ErfK/SrfK